MGLIKRGVGNAFRNATRSLSITFTLAISIGLALVMLLAMRAVDSRIASVKSTIGNTITVSPAGSRGFAGGGEPLTMAQIDQIQATPHVVHVAASINDRLSTIGQTTANLPGGDSSAASTTNLVSSIDAGTLGRRFGGRFGADASGQAAANFTLPIMVTGTTDPSNTAVNNASQFKLTGGSTIDGSGSQKVALVGKSLAAKNNLNIGSTFTAYAQTITVSGIFDAGNTFANGGLIMPLATIQNLSGQPGDVTNALVQVDSVSNLSSTASTISSKLGSAADVVSSQDAATQAVAPLESIKTISVYSLIGALIAGSIIIFLTMLMIVRERRREIGVLKAIGSSNAGIMAQFAVESLTLTGLGALVGIVIGSLLANPILGVLVTSNTGASPGGGPGGGGFGRRLLGGAGNAINLRSLHAAISYDILLYGLLAAVIIAILGSAIPSWLIAKVRPAEVMRAE